MLSLVKKNLYKTVLSFIVLVLKKNLSMGGGGGLNKFYASERGGVAYLRGGA